jgi:tetratricopeptide (TPR) repeat protein
VTPPAAPVPPPALERLVAGHRQRAEALERNGDLRRALDEWKIALTLQPDDPAARAGKTRAMGLIEQGVADRVRQGREALARGDRDTARRQYLAALALHPANRATFDGLRAVMTEVRLAALQAQPVLAIAAPTRPRAAGSARAPAEPAAEDTEEANPLLLEAREAFDRGQYEVVLTDVEKILALNPKNAEAVELQKAALYREGKQQIERRNDAESVRTLTTLAKLDPGYEDAPALLTAARSRLAQKYYADGLRLFREEKLEAAIASWRTVLEYDPAHASAKKNIEQAERMLRTLQEQQPKR